MKLRFEQLERRIALSHAVADHIHARLTIEIDGSNRGKLDGEGFIPSGQKASNLASERLDDGFYTHCLLY